jgi:hypothetical protein
MSAVQIVFVPIPVAGSGWLRQGRPPPYPQRPRDRAWPPSQPIPRDESQLRDLLTNARRHVAENRQHLGEMARFCQRP